MPGGAGDGLSFYFYAPGKLRVCFKRVANPASVWKKNLKMRNITAQAEDLSEGKTQSV